METKNQNERKETMTNLELNDEAKLANRGAIEVKLEQLAKSIGELKSSIEVLEVSINPVLFPDLPENGIEDNPAGATGKSPVCELLSDHVQEVRYLNNLVKRITDRVEL